MNKTLMTCLVAVFLAFSATAGATVAKKQKPVSAKTYKALETARKLIGEEKYGEAERGLTALLPKVAEDAYESALAHQTLAYLYLDRQDYGRARDALESALNGAGTLPGEVVQNLRYNLAQVCVQTERYARGAEILEQWYANEKEPSADAWYLGGLIEYKRKRYAAAVPYLERALAKSGREEWYLLLLSIHVDREEYGKAVPVLKRLLGRYPEKRKYWMHLVDVYLMQKNYSGALSTLQLVHMRYELEEKDLLRLAQLYLQSDLPYNAARLLEREMGRGGIRTNARNLQLLADSWTMAREPSSAYKHLKRAAELKNDGALYLRCAQLLLKMERWGEGVSMLEKALGRGGLKNPAQAQLMLGIAAFRQGRYDKAEAAFKRASGDRRVRDQAKRWLQHVKAERHA